MRALILLVTLLPIVAGCASTAPPTRAPDRAALLDRALAAYEQYVLPNSMAHSDDVDPEARQLRRLREFEATSAPLHTPEGVAFVDARLSTETDDVATMCYLRILEESGQPSAAEALRKYVHGDRQP